MSVDSILKCLIAFVLGFLVARMIRGSGLKVGGETSQTCWPGRGAGSTCFIKRGGCCDKDWQCGGGGYDMDCNWEWPGTNNNYGQSCKGHHGTCG